MKGLLQVAAGMVNYMFSIYKFPCFYTDAIPLILTMCRKEKGS